MLPCSAGGVKAEVSGGQNADGVCRREDCWPESSWVLKGGGRGAQTALVTEVLSASLGALVKNADSQKWGGTVKRV